jgi:hypothetical protein
MTSVSTALLPRRSHMLLFATAAEPRPSSSWTWNTFCSRQSFQRCLLCALAGAKLKTSACQQLRSRLHQTMPQRATTGHNGPQRATTGHNGPQRATTGHNRPQATSHKPQGSSKDCIVITRFFYEVPNWNCVILSRVQALKGLFLKDPLDPTNDCSMDADSLIAVLKTFLHHKMFPSQDFIFH